MYVNVLYILTRASLLVKKPYHDKNLLFLPTMVGLLQPQLYMTPFCKYVTHCVCVALACHIILLYNAPPLPP